MSETTTAKRTRKPKAAPVTQVTPEPMSAEDSAYYDALTIGMLSSMDWQREIPASIIARVLSTARTITLDRATHKVK